jgi:crossover junction endodeoxyribonuclease RuvC
MTKIIGIDPGIAATGIGIVEGAGLKIERYSFGSIQTSKNNSLSHRLNQIFSKLLHMLNDTRPDLMIVEDIFSLQKYPKSGLDLGKVSGVILLAGSQVNVPTLEVSVREAKQILTGNGNASKKQLEKAVRNLLNLAVPIKPSHAADAMAMALIGLFRKKTICVRKR